MQAFFSLLSKIEKKQYAPFYLLAGTEPYFIDVICDKISDQFNDPASRDFDRTQFYGKEVAVNEIIETAKRFPMLSSHNVVIIKEAQNISADGLDELAGYVTHPMPSTIVVFCYKHKTFDKRKKLYKIATQQGVVFEAKPLYDNQIHQWIRDRSKALALNIDPLAVELLANYVGTDLTSADNAMQKLKLAVSEAKNIQADHIEKYIGISKAFNSFELQKAIGLGHFSKAYQIVQYLNRNTKEHPIVIILATLHSYFQKLLLLKGLGTAQNLATTLGINPYFLKEYQAAAHRYNMRQLTQALQCILHADLKSKGVDGASQTDSRILEELVIKLFSLK